MWSGRLFQMREAATRNALPPTVDSRVDGTISADVDDDSIVAEHVIIHKWLSLHVISKNCASQFRPFPTFLLSVSLLVVIWSYPGQGYKSANWHFVWSEQSAAGHLFCTDTPSPPFDNIMVIVWRLRGNIIRTVLYIANVLRLQWAQLTKKQFIQPGWALSLSFCFFKVAWFVFMLVYVSLYLGQLSHFPSCCGAGVINLNEPPSSCMLPPHYCGLGAGSIPLRAIVNNKQCETRGLFMSLVIRYWIGDVQDSQGVSVSQIANYKYF